MAECRHAAGVTVDRNKIPCAWCEIDRLREELSKARSHMADTLGHDLEPDPDEQKMHADMIEKGFRAVEQPEQPPCPTCGGSEEYDEIPCPDCQQREGE